MNLRSHTCFCLSQGNIIKIIKVPHTAIKTISPVTIVSPLNPPTPPPPPQCVCSVVFMWWVVSQVEATLLLCLLLPMEHLSTLRFTMGLLSRLATHSTHNKMDVGNLAVVLAPNIMHVNRYTVDILSCFILESRCWNWTWCTGFWMQDAVLFKKQQHSIGIMGTPQAASFCFAVNNLRHMFALCMYPLILLALTTFLPWLLLPPVP